LNPDGDDRDTEARRRRPVIITVRVTRSKDALPLMAESERYGEGVELEYALS
jgi:hypothetical protein